MLFHNFTTILAPINIAVKCKGIESWLILLVDELKQKMELYVKYLKACDVTFNFKGFNLDMNNAVQFECVPNAFIKTYGTKNEKSYMSICT